MRHEEKPTEKKVKNKEKCMETIQRCEAAAVSINQTAFVSFETRYAGLVSSNCDSISAFSLPQAENATFLAARIKGIVNVILVASNHKQINT